MNKTLMHKGIAIMLAAFVALVAAFALALPAYATTSEVAEGATASPAAADSTTSIEAKTGNANDTLNMYKVVTVTYANNQLTYVFTPTFQAFLDAADPSAPYKGLTIDQYTVGAYDAEAVLGAFTAYVRNASPALAYDKSEQTDVSGVANFTEVGLGQYIIVGMGNTNGAKIYQTVTAEVVPTIVDGAYVIYSKYVVDLKTTEPGGDKEITGGTVTDGSNATASIGKPISYKLNGDVPVYPAGAKNTTVVMGDKLSKGLTLDRTTVKAYKDTATGTVELNPGTDYTLTYQVNSDGTTTMYVSFVYDNIKDATKLHVTYDAVLNENAVIGGATGNPNDYTFIYSNNPFKEGTYTPGDEDNPNSGYGKKTDKETVFTYSFYIYKTDNNTANPTALKGAVFELKTADGTVVATLTTDDKGYAAVDGPQAGSYKLQETTAPTGYKLMSPNPKDVSIDASHATSAVTTTTTVHYTTVKDYAAIKVQATDAQGKLLWLADGATGDNPTASETQPAGMVPAYVLSIETKVDNTSVQTGQPAGTGYTPENIKDEPGGNLPVTGGMGTYLLYGAGIALVLIAGIAYFVRRRSARQK